MVADALPEPRLVLAGEPQTPQPLGTLPEVQVRDQQSGRAAVLGLQGFVLEAIGHPRLPVGGDPAFLDVAGTQQLFGPAVEVAQRIKDDIRRDTRLVASVGVTAVVLAVANRFLLGYLVPTSVTLIGGLLALALMVGIRYTWRLLLERRLRPSGEHLTRVLVFGAGEGGARLITAMLRTPESPYLPVAILDDDRTKANLRMRTHNGSIRTNFPDGVLQAKSEKASRTNANSNTNQDSISGKITQAEQREVARHVAREAAKAGREQAEMAREIARNAREAVQVAIHGASEDSEMPVPPMPPIPPMPNFGGKSIVGALNGGGIDIKLTSMNGTITLREAK